VGQVGQAGKKTAGAAKSAAGPDAGSLSREAQKRADAEAKKKQRAEKAKKSQIEELEARIADTEKALRDIEATMAAPGFYDDRTTSQPVIDRHQALMWTVGDLMHQWEELQRTTKS
jgi:hypothetical protein